MSKYKILNLNSVAIVQNSQTDDFVYKTTHGCWFSYVVIWIIKASCLLQYLLYISPGVLFIFPKESLSLKESSPNLASSIKRII